MADQTIGLIILGVTVVVFAIFGVVLWWGRRLRYPPGIREDTGGDGFRVVTVVEPGELISRGFTKRTLGAHCHLAIKCTIDAWKQQGLPGDARGKLDGMCCLFLSDESFETPVAGGKGLWEGWLSKQSAYLAQVPRATGSGPPMAVIRAKFIELVIETGEPVTHEALHACCHEGGLGRWQHDNPKVWAAAGVDCVQAKAWDKFEGNA